MNFQSSGDLFSTYYSARSTLELDEDHLGYGETVLAIIKFVLTHPEIDRYEISRIIIEGGDES